MFKWVLIDPLDFNRMVMAVLIIVKTKS